MPSHPLSHYVAVARKLRALSGRTSTRAQVTDSLRLLLDDYQQLGMPPLPSQCWTRVSKLEGPDHFHNLYRLIYRPHPAATLQRATPLGYQVVYAAGNLRVAMDEIDATTGDIVGSIGFRQHALGRTPTWIVGEYDSILNAGYSLLGADKNETDLVTMRERQPDLLNHFHYIDAVLSEMFRRPISDALDYLPTALVAEQAFLTGAAIAYPSVQTHRGMNVAVPKSRFDRDYEVLFAGVWRVVESYGSGIYELELLCESCDFQSNGGVNWQSSRKLPHTWSLKGGVEVPPDYVGWRIPY